MDPIHALHNSHRDGLESFLASDPQLRALRRQPLVYTPPLVEELPTLLPGIYTLGGGRQIGKTTLLKQWIEELLRSGIDPRSIVFLTGELINDHHQLIRWMQAQLGTMPTGSLHFFLLDEVTYIRDWDQAIKFCADSGLLENVVLIVTGSDLTFVRETRTMLPGRRGTADRVDFHLHPLDYGAVARLTGILRDDEVALLSGDDIAAIDDLPYDTWERAYEALERYLVHGGFLTAINDMARDQTILPATLATYSDWIRGDMLKRGKQDLYLREVLESVTRRLGSQVTWNALARELSIDHPRTVADYVDLLTRMDALFVLPALLEGRLSAAPKKARKIFPCDPFIYHAIRAWLAPTRNPHEDQIVPACEDAATASQLVESTVVNHARRNFPTFYIKAEGEVDLAVVHGNRFWPLEVKWRTQTRPKDLKQVGKYSNGIVASRVRRRHLLGSTPIVPLPVALCRLVSGHPTV